MAPSSSTTCTKTYTLTQADVDLGSVHNEATATGTEPTGTEVTASDATDTDIPASPAIALDKIAGTPSGSAAGDTIDYTFVVTNMGNVTLDPVVVDDPAVGTVDCPAGPLAPSDSIECSATYTLTQTDIDSGHFANTATATGTPPTGAEVIAVDDTDTPIDGAPVITLAKSAAAPTGSRRVTRSTTSSRSRTPAT